MSDLVERMVYTGTNKPWWMANSASMDTEKGSYGGLDAITAERVIELVPEIATHNVEKRQAGWYSVNRNKWFEADADQFLVNTNTGKVMGRCTSQYQEYQALEAMAFLDKVVADGDAKYHTAGILDGGKKVWFLIQTPGHYDVIRVSGKRDRHYQFIMASQAFTGKDSNWLCGTDVNVVCANTEAMALNGSELKFRIPHKGDMNACYAKAREALEAVSDARDTLQDENQMLAETMMDTKGFIEFSTGIFLNMEGDDKEIEDQVEDWFTKASDRSKTMLENKVKKTAKLFRKGIGNEGVSSYDALQAFTEYFDHFDIGATRDKIANGKKAAKALTSAFDGQGARIKSTVRARLIAAA